MKKSIISISIFLAIVISSTLCLGKSAVNEKHFITLSEGFLSIDAQEISAESIFKDLVEVCGIKIIANEHSFPSSLVSVKFKDIPLEEAVKKILKVTGVKNYLIRYQEIGDTYRISEIDFLGDKGESQVFTPKQRMPTQRTKAVPKTSKVKTTTSSVVRSEKEIDEEIEAIEGKFEWDDDKTVELVKEVLRGAPPHVKKYALEGMIESIKTNLKKEGNRPVDKEMIYKATEDAIPPDMPEIGEKVRKYLDSLDRQ